MKKGLWIGLIAVMLAAFAFAGCAPAEDRSSADYYGEAVTAGAPAAEPMVDMDNGGDYAADMDDAVSDEKGYDGVEDTATTQDTGGLGMENGSSILEPTVERKIIYNGYVEARTKNFDEDYDMILEKLKEVGGYLENSYIYGTEPEDWQDSGRSAQMTLRIPSSKFDMFIELLGDVGQTVSSQISGRDISLEYFDVETRLATLRIREERLQELLKQAAGLEDIIELERELANVSYEIQSYEITLRDYDSLVDFSTITVTLQEVHDVAKVTPADETIGERITNGFYTVINALADFGEWLLVVIVAGFPIIIIIVVIVVVIVVLVKRSKKRKMAAAAKLQNSMNTKGDGENEK